MSPLLAREWHFSISTVACSAPPAPPPLLLLPASPGESRRAPSPLLCSILPPATAPMYGPRPPSPTTTPSPAPSAHTSVARCPRLTYPLCTRTRPGPPPRSKETRPTGDHAPSPPLYLPICTSFWPLSSWSPRLHARAAAWAAPPRKNPRVPAHAESNAPRPAPVGGGVPQRRPLPPPAARPVTLVRTLSIL